MKRMNSKIVPAVEPKRTRGRPRLFDREDVLRRAMHVFWSKGFHETSVLDLTEAMQMTPPSIYLAFGGKERLFETAFLLYLQEGAVGLPSLQGQVGTEDAIRSMLKNVVTVLTGFTQPRGCMSIVGSLSLQSEHAELRELLRRTRRATLGAIQARLRKAKKNGELPPKSDPVALACLCRTLWSGVSIEILDGVSRPALFAAIDLFVDMIGFNQTHRS